MGGRQLSVAVVLLFVTWHKRPEPNVAAKVKTCPAAVAYTLVAAFFPSNVDYPGFYTYQPHPK
jgi:hypothetical protein